MQLALAVIYTLVFITSLLYLMRLNHYKFTKRTKIVFICLFIMLLLQTSAAIISLVKSNEPFTENCRVTALAYSLVSWQHIFMMLIYTFMVCRMLSIYFKLRKAEKPNDIVCKTKCAGFIADAQNYILISYFLLATGGIWFNFYLFKNDYNKQI